MAANPITNIDCIWIELNIFGPSIMTSTITNNYLSLNSAVSCSEIQPEIDADSFASTTDNGTHTATVTGNHVSGSNGQGIFAIARGSTGTLNAHILNNTVSAPTSGSYGIQVSSGSSAGDTIVNIEVSSNNTTGGTNTATSTTFPGIGLRKQGADPAVNELLIKGMAEGITGTRGVEDYVNSQNTSASGTFGFAGTALVSATTGFTNDTPGGC